MRVRKLAKPAKAAVKTAGIDDFGLDSRLFDRWLEPLLDLLYTRYFRVSVSGLENIPAQGKALVVANHSGPIPFDGPMILQAIRKHHPARRHIRYLVLRWLVNTPFAAQLIPRLGFVLACRENARTLLKRGELVGVFPEGDKGTGKLFRDRYRMVRFGRGGFAEIALEAEAPIIPTAVVGGEETYPVLAHARPIARLLGLPYFPITPFFPWFGVFGTLPLPVKFHIHFGKPIRLKPGSAKKAHDYMTANALSDLVRNRIQQQLDELLRKRKGVF